MGFLLTLLLAIVFGALGLVRPKTGFYILVALIVFFEEMGPGFTTFRGSWVFNAYFVGFYGLRLIEVLTVSLYIPFLFSKERDPAATMPFQIEKKILVVFVIWSAILTLMEYYYTKRVEVASWRLLVTGAMQFHLMVCLFRSTDERMKFVKIIIIMMAIRALFGLAMFAAGYGVHSPRGRVPFFYDSKQIEAFALGAIILWSLVLNAGAIAKDKRPFGFFLLLLMLSVLLIAVGGSIRRTIWFTTALAMLIVLILSRRTTILHYFGILFVAIVAVAALLLAPGLDDFRSHYGKYVQSMNLLDDYQFSQNAENDVHVKNVESYSRMLLENPDLLVVGVHGPSSNIYRELMASYSEGGYRLGMAHNGPIRSLISFGVVGFVAYFILFFLVTRRTYIIHSSHDDARPYNHIAIACGVVLFLDFAATMVFVPPFYTSSKGLFYTFFEMFILGAGAAEVSGRKKSVHGHAQPRSNLHDAPTATASASRVARSR